MGLSQSGHVTRIDLIYLQSCPEMEEKLNEYSEVSLGERERERERERSPIIVCSYIVMDGNNTMIGCDY